MSILTCPVVTSTDWEQMESSVGATRAYDIYTQQNGEYPKLGVAMNGKPSKVYSSLSRVLSKEDADKVFYNLHSIEFADFFGSTRASKHVDDNGEPILYKEGFRNNAGVVLPVAELLKDEIVSRYYYQKGAIIAALENDQDIKRGLELFHSPATYARILLPPAVLPAPAKK